VWGEGEQPWRSRGKVIDRLGNRFVHKPNRTYSSKPVSLLLSFFFSCLAIGGSTIGSDSVLVVTSGLSFCVGT